MLPNVRSRTQNVTNLRAASKLRLMRTRGESQRKNMGAISLHSWRLTARGVWNAASTVFSSGRLRSYHLVERVLENA